MNSKKNLSIKMIAKVCFVFVLVLLFVGIMKGNLTYANLDNVYYLEDLRVGDFIPYGSTILTTIDYHGYSGSYYIAENGEKKYSGGYINNAHLYYQNFMQGCNYDKEYLGSCFTIDTIMNNSSYDLKTFSDVVHSSSSAEDEYIGWVVYKTYSSTVYLEPVSDYSKINNTPSLDNSYMIDTYFVDSDESLIENSWYRVTEINDYNIDNDFWIKDNNLFRFRNTGIYDTNTSYVLSFKFDAEEGDIVSFDIRGGLGYLVRKSIGVDEFIIEFNGNVVSDPLGISCNFYSTDTASCHQKNDLYVTTRLSVTDSGEQTLTFTYINNGQVYDSSKISLYTYGYVKNLRVLSLLNEGKQLDTTLVKDGDVLYYMSVGDGIYILDQYLTYTSLSNEDVSNEVVDDEEDKVDNPITFDYICFFLIAIIICLTIAYFTNKKLKLLK